MWTLGVALGLVLAFISGLAKGMSNRILFHPETLPKYFRNSFWLFNGEIDDNGEYIILPAKLRRFKDFDKSKGGRFLGSRNIFIGITSGYHFMEFLHAFTLSAGSILLSISIFFFASSIETFIREQTLLLVAIYAARCLGKFLTYRSGESIFKF